jgi:hypothetical protein
MARWLVNLLIVIGFLALVAMALLPKHVVVSIDIDGSVRHDGGARHAEPAEAQPGA